MSRIRENKMLSLNLWLKLKMNMNLHGKDNLSMLVCFIQQRMKMVISKMLSQWMPLFTLHALDGNSSSHLFHHHIMLMDGLASSVLYL